MIFRPTQQCGSSPSSQKKERKKRWAGCMMEREESPQKNKPQQPRRGAESWWVGLPSNLYACVCECEGRKGQQPGVEGAQGQKFRGGAATPFQKIRICPVPHHAMAGGGGSQNRSPRVPPRGRSVGCRRHPTPAWDAGVISGTNRQE